MIMAMDLDSYASMVSRVAVPILLCNATLLGLVSLRNQHVSDRARANVLEVLYQLPNLSEGYQPSDFHPPCKKSRNAAI
jgi:hypothetical protein